ncbi:hypothetical protein [Amycolatopsis sp. H20-H5]|uniref:hypothetical protein n=1 Tax=Amycolatopsis sp. H20-H5 TaxID=3046309 RepID=UPI002DB6CA6B|nr:hypothetical protein [Amycolatopsis sp. H20-H5]MEC3980230.1 hypothetical protein [Amycolatopsis sp. H20-H5]
MADLHIEPDQVKKVAGEVSSMATSFDEMKSYTAKSQLAASHFGKIPGLSESAGAYVAKAQELGASVAKAGAFLKDYATRLNQSATLHGEHEQEATWGINKTGKDL